MIRRTHHRHRARPWSRALTAALASLLLLTAVGCDPADINAAITSDGDNATASSLNSGANGASLTLTDGRTVFLSNDAYVGALNANGTRTSSTMVRNALVVHNGNSRTTVMGASQTAYLKPSNSANYYRLGSAAANAEATDMWIFAEERSSSTDALVSIRLIRVMQSTLAPPGQQVTISTDPSGPTWGQHVFKRGAYWYIYGYSQGATPSTYVARTPDGNLTVLSSWRYFNGSTWVTSQAQASPIRDEAGQVVDQALTPVSRPGLPMNFLGRDPVGQSTGFTSYSAASVSGPVTAETVVHTASAWGQSCGSGGVGHLHHHPNLTDVGDSPVFSYARPCSATSTLPADYRPVFFSANPTAWRTSWASAINRVDPAQPFYGDLRNGIASNRSLRYGLHLSRGGSTVRIRISNEYGPGTLNVGAASIARSPSAESATAAVATTPVAVTFGGQASVAIPAGTVALSDAITLPTALPSDHDAAVTLYLPNGAPADLSGHLNHLETSYVGTGNRTAQVDATGFTTSTASGFLVSAVEVLDPASQTTLVAIGDSLTDGFGTTLDEECRWTDVVYDRAKVSGPPIAVANLGISGNTLNRWGGADHDSVLDRFDRDVLKQPGVRTVVAWIGLNDITIKNATASQMRSGFTELVRRAQEAGLKIIISTITPLRGPNQPSLQTLGLTEEEAVRQSINTSIRNNVFGADGVIDIDALVRDPSDPSKVRLAYANVGLTGERGNHFNDTGSAVIGNAIYDQFHDDF